MVALPGVTTVTGLSCSPVPDPTNTGSWTDSFDNIKCYDTLKVEAVLNWINGNNHLGTAKAPVPALFGMNFQAVSVGQKLIEKTLPVAGRFGGYKNAAGTPTDQMEAEIEFVDASIGSMVNALKAQGLLESTLIIVTAKHGQSPIDPNRFRELGAGITTTPADVLANYPANANLLPFSESPLNPSGIGPTQDDISLIWLANSQDTLTAVGLLESSGVDSGIGQIFYGPSLQTMFNAPGIPAIYGGNGGDSRTPDIIGQPYTGVVFTGSSKKQAEHGGFAQDDTNVMLLVSNPNIEARTVTSFVETTQVAPTILEALGLDPTTLQAVQKEGTPVLPGIDFKSAR